MTWDKGHFSFCPHSTFQDVRNFIFGVAQNEKSLLCPFSVSAIATITGAVSWRKEGIKHKKNEVFLDVVEKLNLLVAQNGTVLHSEILGSLKMKSYLSGMPELKLGLNDKIMMEKEPQ